MENYLKNNLTEVIQTDSSVFDFLQQSALDGFWLLDAKNSSSFWFNPKLLSVLGFSSIDDAEKISKSWDFFLNENNVSALLTSESPQHSEKTIKLSYLHQNGAVIEMECAVKFITDNLGNPKSIIGANTKIEENFTQKNKTIQFHQSIGESALESNFLYVLKTDINGNYIFINDYFYKVFGFEEKDILGTNALLSIVPDDHDACRETVMKCFMYPQKAFKAILRKENKFKEIITNQWEFTGLPDENGQTFEILCIGYNVSEKVKTENDLSILVSNMTDLLIAVNPTGIITFVSPNVETLYDYEVNDILGKNYIDFIHPEDLDPSIEAIRQTITSGVPFTNLEVRIQKKHGEYFWSNINSSLNPFNKETILVINDISTKVESLRELKQAKELLQEISEVSNVGGWEYFPEKNEFFWSDISRKIFDLPLLFPPNLEKIQKFLKPKSRKSFQRAIKLALQKNQSSDLELEITTHTNQEIWLRSIIKADFQNNNCSRVYGTFQDINQLKKAEIAREKTSKLLRHLTKQVPGTLFQFKFFDDGRSYFPYISRGVVQTETDFNEESEERTKSLFKVIHPEDLPRVFSEINKTYHSLEITDTEFRVISENNAIRWLRAISTPERLKDGVIWHGYMSDVTDRKLVEQELRRTKDFLQETTQVARIGGWEADLDANTSYWSQITTEIHEIQQESNTIYIPEAINYYKEGFSRETVRKAIDECVTTGQPFDIEVQLITAKNNEIWVRIIGKFDNTSPNKKRIYGTFQDITEKKIAEFQLTRTKDLLEETNKLARIGGWSFDTSTYQVHWSEMVKEIIQVPKDFKPSIEAGLKFYKEGYSRNLITESLNNCINDGTPFEVELQVTTTSNQDIWVKIIGKAAIEAGKIKRVYGIFQDINQSKIAEENAKNLHKLEVLLTKEKQLNVLKSRFISLTSHEFRTPLAGILGSTELLDLYVENLENTLIQTKLKEHIRHITSQVDRLTGIVTDILTLEKTAEGKINVKIQGIAIKAFLMKITDELFINLRDSRKLNLILPDEEKVILTDESLLIHILNNLISNAFKYSRGISKSPDVKLSYGDALLTITVTDYGMGIPMKDQAHLFESFFRADNVVSTEGTGLGLSIAKEFTEKLGGHIHFHSQEGSGSTFTLTLPYIN